MDINHFTRIDVPLTTTLAMLVTLAYVFGILYRRKKDRQPATAAPMRKDMSRATMAANELGKVVCLFAIARPSTTHASRSLKSESQDCVSVKEMQTGRNCAGKSRAYSIRLFNL